MENALIVNLLLGYHDYDYYTRLVDVRRLQFELCARDINALSDKSLDLLTELIVKDFCPGK